MAARATVVTKAPATPATPATKKKKKKTRTAATTASRKMTFAQFQRYKVFLRKQEEKRGSNTFVGSHNHKECVERGNLHQSKVKPSYASILKMYKAPSILCFHVVVLVLFQDVPLQEVNVLSVIVAFLVELASDQWPCQSW